MALILSKGRLPQIKSQIRGQSSLKKIHAINSTFAQEKTKNPISHPTSLSSKILGQDAKKRTKLIEGMQPISQMCLHLINSSKEFRFPHSQETSVLLQDALQKEEIK
jgi:hypothetical protein